MIITQRANMSAMTEPPAGIAELNQRIPFLLSQLGVYLADDFVHRLQPLGVEPRTYAVLMTLFANDGQSQRELSQRLGIHRNVMVSVIDNLEAKGLVERLPHPTDRRAFAVTMTAQARRLLPTLDAEGRAQEDQLAAPLSADERLALLHQLQKISAALGLIPGVHPKLA
jgi:DNA-binding MarR family transcriptional regulator